MEIKMKETATEGEPIYVESQSLVGNILETNIDKLRNLKILEVYMNNFNGHLNRLGMYLQVLNIG
jgi:hypothetical protein